MLARGVLCRLAAEVPKTTTHDLPQLSRLVQRALLRRNAVSPASIGALSHSFKLALSISRRGYATSAGTKPTKTVKRAVKKTASKKSSPAGKKTTASKKAAPKKRKTAKKAKKAAPKKRTRAKKEVTPEAKEKAAIKDLKVKALREPAKRATIAWSIFVGEYAKDHATTKDLGTRAKEAAERYRNLSPAEREHYNHLANENKAQNEKDYKTWVESHTPDQIRIANNARLNLRRRYKTSAKKGSRVYPPHTQQIVDVRQPKRGRTPYTLFFQERVASGDLKGISIPESARLVGNEWKALSASEQKKYEDAAAVDRTRYEREYKSAYGHETPSRSSSASS